MDNNTKHIAREIEVSRERERERERERLPKQHYLDDATMND